MSDARYQLPHIHADNSYTEYLEARYWAERERRERECNERENRKLHRRLWRKLQQFADWFDATFGWFFCPRRYN